MSRPPIITADDLCVAAELTLREHLPVVLQQLVDLEGEHADPSWRELEEVATWEQIPDWEALQAADFPAGAITSPGLVEAPTRKGRTTYDGTWRLVAGIYDRGGSFRETQRRARRWAAVLRVTLLEHPTLGGIATDLMWRGEEYRQLPQAKVARTLGGCAVAFDVTLRDVADLQAATTRPSLSTPTTSITVRP